MMHAFKPAGASPDFEISRAWPVVRLWRIANVRSEKNSPDLPLLSVFLGRGIIRYGEGGGQVHKPGQDLSTYQVVRPGDFVLNNQQAWRGSVGVSKYHGIISPAYVVLGLNKELNPHFANYLFQSRVMVAQFVTSSKGVGDIQRDIHIPWLKNAKVPIPPLEDQTAIVRFLNHANDEIERATRTKKNLIGLLNEQKQAIIHGVLTRGLDPTLPFKPSGIPWLGDIPKHWEVLRSKYVFREVDDRSSTGTEIHLSMSQKHGLIPSSKIEERRLLSESYAGAKLCRRDDLVLNRLKAHLGVFALAPQDGLVSPDYTVLRPIRKMVPQYFEALYRTRACRVELRKRAKGIVQGFWRLYTDDFYDIRVPVPPLEEQKAIMRKLEMDLSATNDAISRGKQEIELFQEYWTRLVADVVTGKLDVRATAKHLPTEAEESSTPIAANDLVDEAELESVAGDDGA